MFLKQFDTNNISTIHTISIVGRKGTGKTTIVRELIKYISKNTSVEQTVSLDDVKTYTCPLNSPCSECIDIIQETVKLHIAITVISPVDDDIHTSSYIYNVYSPAILSQFISVCDKEDTKETNENNVNILVFDNCMNDGSFLHDEQFKRIFALSKHIQTTILFTMSHCFTFPPILQKQFEYVFILYEKNIQTRLKIYECYKAYFASLYSFNHYMDKYTSKKFMCLVIDLKKQVIEGKYEESLYWYKASIE